MRPKGTRPETPKLAEVRWWGVGAPWFEAGSGGRVRGSPGCPRTLRPRIGPLGGESAASTCPSRSAGSARAPPPPAPRRRRGWRVRAEPPRQSRLGAGKHPRERARGEGCRRPRAGAGLAGGPPRGRTPGAGGGGRKPAAARAGRRGPVTSLGFQGSLPAAPAPSPRLLGFLPASPPGGIAGSQRAPQPQRPPGSLAPHLPSASSLPPPGSSPFPAPPWPRPLGC